VPEWGYPSRLVNGDASVNLNADGQIKLTVADIALFVDPDNTVKVMNGSRTGWRDVIANAFRSYSTSYLTGIYNYGNIDATGAIGANGAIRARDGQGYQVRMGDVYPTAGTRAGIEFGLAPDSKLMYLDDGRIVTNALFAPASIETGIISLAGWWKLTQGDVGGVRFGAGHEILWESAPIAGNGTNDAGLKRHSAGRLKLTDGGTGTGLLTTSGILNNDSTVQLYLEANGLIGFQGAAIYPKNSPNSLGTSVSRWMLYATDIDASGVISSGGSDAGELRSYQAGGTHHVSLKANGLKSGLFRSNADFFTYYHTGTSDVHMDAQFGGANLISILVE
jgi:hypothetical protein